MAPHSKSRSTAHCPKHPCCNRMLAGRKQWPTPNCIGWPCEMKSVSRDLTMHIPWCTGQFREANLKCACPWALELTEWQGKWNTFKIWQWIQHDAPGRSGRPYSCACNWEQLELTEQQDIANEVRPRSDDGCTMMHWAVQQGHTYVLVIESNWSSLHTSRHMVQGALNDMRSLSRWPSSYQNLLLPVGEQPLQSGSQVTASRCCSVTAYLWAPGTQHLSWIHELIVN